MPPKVGVNRKAANGYLMPEKLNEGTILTALNKKQFKIGKSIGVGGFGEIYLCSDRVDKPVGDDAPYALKVEPHENGPLFVEMNFYIRAAMPETIEGFRKLKGLSSLGIPCHRGSGSQTVNGKKCRFLVMDRFGSDLEKIFQTGRNPFSDEVVFNLAIKITDSLEYIHEQGYIHNDVKAQNLLLGFGKENDVFVVDFGLSTKFTKADGHLKFKPDPKKAHDGTIEYTSRDAHIGTHSRRSDLEVLAYNIVHWLSGTLPWMNKLASPEAVHTAKKNFFESIKVSLDQLFDGKSYPDVLLTFLTYVDGLQFEEKPNYDKIRAWFRDALRKAKHPLDSKLDFVKAKPVASPSKKIVTPKKPENGHAKLNGARRIVDCEIQKSPAIVRATGTKSKPKLDKVDDFVAKAVDAAKKATASFASPTSKPPPRRAVSSCPPDEALSELNPTPAMIALLKMRDEKEKKVKKRKKPGENENNSSKR